MLVSVNIENRDYKCEVIEKYLSETLGIDVFIYKRKAGITTAELSKIYKVSRALISNIINYKDGYKNV